MLALLLETAPLLALLTAHSAPVVRHGRPSAVTQSCPQVRMGVAAASNSVFQQWADSNGISAPSLQLVDYSGIRGVGATRELQPNERVLAVPSKLALQVTSMQRAPKWADEGLWRSAPWHHRLALTLLHEESLGAASPLRPWLAELPRSFGTPIFWSEEQLDALGYPPLKEAVQKQRTEWDGLVDKLNALPNMELATDKEAVYRALSVVRSRSFSGPYARGTFKGSLVQLFVACTLAGAYAIAGGNVELGLDCFLGVAVYVLANDLFFSRATNVKRYVLCPFIDMMNHASARAATDVSYEYFSDNFAVVLDAHAVKEGEQAYICYGPRSNDALLQYYGFVEEGNPNDSVKMQQRHFLLDLADVSPYDPSAVRALAGLDLPDTLSFSRAGADETTLRIARLILYPAEAAAASGRVPLPLAAEVSVLNALAAVAKRASARFAGGVGVGFGEAAAAPAPGKKGKKGAAEASGVELAAGFRREKSSVLDAAVQSLSERAQASETAGVVIEPEVHQDASARAMPGLGLTKIA